MKLIIRESICSDINNGAVMDNPKVFLEEYFDQIFLKRNLNYLDKILDEHYWDDDIGDSTINHIKQSKEYLKNQFKEYKNIRVIVGDVIQESACITAFLKWLNGDNEIMKGVGVFEMKNGKIIKRHTYIYKSLVDNH